MPTNCSRRYIIGIDEAGYGPNLGPLVIAASVWSLPQHEERDLWDICEEILTHTPGRNDSRLHVGDSKEVYSPSKGLSALELAVLSLIEGPTQLMTQETSNVTCDQFLISQLTNGLPESFASQPWYENNSSDELELPIHHSRGTILDRFQQVQQNLTAANVQLERTGLMLICPEHFNEKVRRFGNKGALLTRETLHLMQRMMSELTGSVEIYADKHGGRNRYLPFLTEVFSDRFWITKQESQSQSRYQDGSVSISFSINSERFLPVALASMLAKYVRELCMLRFNRFWQTHCPDVKPTKGYPVDAARFRRDIEDVWHSMNLPETILWRTR